MKRDKANETVEVFAAHGDLLADILPLGANLGPILASTRLHELIGGGLLGAAANCSCEGGPLGPKAPQEGCAAPLRGGTPGPRELVRGDDAHVPPPGGPRGLRGAAGPDAAGPLLRHRDPRQLLRPHRHAEARHESRHLHRTPHYYLLRT
jgi:hypothetical protein